MAQAKKTPTDTVLVRNIKENSVTPVKNAPSVLRVYKAMPRHFEIIDSPEEIDAALKQAKTPNNPVTESDASGSDKSNATVSSNSNKK